MTLCNIFLVSSITDQREGRAILSIWIFATLTVFLKGKEREPRKSSMFQASVFLVFTWDFFLGEGRLFARESFIQEWMAIILITSRKHVQTLANNWKFGWHWNETKWMNSCLVNNDVHSCVDKAENSFGDVSNKVVADFGCGCGTLGIAAALLGAE